MPLGSRASATDLAVKTASIIGTAYVSVSVSSNMMTAKETVVLFQPNCELNSPTKVQKNSQ